MLNLNKVYCFDANKGIELLEDNSIDLIVTDPPYDVDYGKKSKELSKLGKPREKQVKRDESYKTFNIDYLSFSKQMFRVLKDDSHLYLFLGELQFSMWYDALIKAGFKWGNLLIWVKNAQTFDMTRGLRYCHKHELCIYVRKGVKRLNKLGLSTVMKFNRSNNNIHPCQKPDKLIRYLIKNSSNEGDVIADFFMGSGTTAIVSKQLNRQFIGFEYSSEYVDMINKRLKQNNLNEFDLNNWVD